MVGVLSLGDSFPQYLPLIVTLGIVAAGLSFANWALKKRSRWVGKQQNFVRPLVMLGLTVLMLRSVGSFRSGDFIEVEGNFGRVSARGLFHTEIQTENRDLTTLPNLYLVSNPVKVVRSSGTIVSANVSLGYDTSQSRVEGLLKEAARQIGLGEPFVQIVDLGDFTVNYRVAGFLEDVNGLVSARSNLRVEVLNTLHNADIEVMSPSVMMQRPIPAGERIMPRREISSRINVDVGQSLLEEIIFDKAEEAEAVEMREKKLADCRVERDELKKKLEEAGEVEKATIQSRIASLEKRMDSIKASLDNLG
jgi:small conductance mechanosensitive channel